MNTLRIAILNVILVWLIGCGAGKPPINQTTNDIRFINIGTIKTLESEILGEEREIWVHVPESAKESERLNKIYPVLYLLDGNSHFHSVTGLISQFSQTSGYTEFPEMIVVGVLNTDRTRDLTPTNVNGTSGGNSKFNRFLEYELIPYVENNFPASKYRTLAGHSFGGLAVINTMLNNPELFTNFVSIDPSLWWDNQYLLSELPGVTSNSDFSNKSLYLAAANTMRGQSTFEEARNENSRGTATLRAILLFADLLSLEINSQLNFQWKYYEDHSHGSVPLVALYDSIEYLFSWYSYLDLTNFYITDRSTSASELLEMLVEHFDVISSHFGYLVLPPEEYVESRGRAFLSNERYDPAFAFFNLNLENYPNSAGAHVAMGDYYSAVENIDNAVLYFQRALEIEASDSVFQKIAILRR